MPEPVPNDRFAKIRDGASNMTERFLDQAIYAVREKKAKDRAEAEANLIARNAVSDISDILRRPRTDDPLYVIREIENLLGLEHYDWAKCGKWRRNPS